MFSLNMIRITVFPKMITYFCFYVSYRKIINIYSCFCRLCLSGLAVGACWYWNDWLLSKSPFLTYMTESLTVVLLGLPPLIQLSRESLQHIAYRGHVQNVTRLTEHMKNLRSCMKKAVRLIQETELVSRGFTL